MAKTYLALPYEYREEMSELSDAEFGRLCRALLDYSENGTPMALCGNERFFVKRCMMMEQRLNSQYEGRSKGGKGKNKGEVPSTESNLPELNATESNSPELNATESHTRLDKTRLDYTFSNENERIDSDESICPTGKQTDVHEAVKLWNALGLGQVTKLTAGSERYKLLNARLKQYGLDGWTKALDEIRQSEWLKGNGNKGWVITFDWLIKPNNFPKVHDGNYRDRSTPESKPWEYDYGTDEGYVGL